MTFADVRPDHLLSCLGRLQLRSEVDVAGRRPHDLFAKLHQMAKLLRRRCHCFHRHCVHYRRCQRLQQAHSRLFRAADHAALVRSLPPTQLAPSDRLYRPLAVSRRENGRVATFPGLGIRSCAIVTRQRFVKGRNDCVSSEANLQRETEVAIERQKEASSTFSHSNRDHFRKVYASTCAVDFCCLAWTIRYATLLKSTSYYIGSALR